MVLSAIRNLERNKRWNFNLRVRQGIQACGEEPRERRCWLGRLSWGETVMAFWKEKNKGMETEKKKTQLNPCWWLLSAYTTELNSCWWMLSAYTVKLSPCWWLLSAYTTETMIVLGYSIDRKPYSCLLTKISWKPCLYLLALLGWCLLSLSSWGHVQLFMLAHIIEHLTHSTKLNSIC